MMEGARRINMKLKCRIHEQDYDIVAGAAFSEEYNETLDSGTIIVDQYPKIVGLKPYDDVYIWNSDDNFYGYYNVGDKLLASNVGATADFTLGSSASGMYSDKIITDPNMPNNMNVNDDYVGFYSHRIADDGRTYPSIIDLWLACFLYSIDLSGTATRWVMPAEGFVMKLTLSNSQLGTLTGYYKLPDHQEDNVIPNPYSNKEFLKLTKSTDYSSSANAPDVLYVKYTAQICPIGGVTMVSQMCFSFETTTLSSLPGTEDDVFTITAIDKPSNSDYSYIYRFRDSGDDGIEEMPEILVFNFDGLTKDEMLAIDASELELDVVCRGYGFHGYCKSITWNQSNQRINFDFVFDLDENYPAPPFQVGDGFSLSFSKVYGSDTQWRVNHGYFSLKFEGETYPIDAIISNLLDNLYFTVPNSKSVLSRLPKFFKHLLVDRFTYERLDLINDDDVRLYKHKINLMSETKRLEKVILPNVSITQPIIGQKRSIWYYLNQFVDLYSPKIKVKDKGNTWVYRNKYKIDARSIGDYFVGEDDISYNADDLYINIPVHEIFNDEIYSPEMSLSAPTLRELISRLMIVKDCIPIVKNDVIYAMKINEDRGEFKIDDDNFSFITESMDSSNYSTSFRREYGGAISQKNTAHLVEFLGFRTSGSSSGIMTLDNMTLETRFPIYKVNKLCMCYFRTVTMRRKYNDTTYDKLVLIKQDITKLVLQNTVRNALPADWTTVQSGEWGSTDFDINEMAKNKVFTVGYSIGSNLISGWGENVSYISDLLGWARQKLLYVELIFRKMNSLNAWGINQYQFIGPDEEIVNADTNWYSIVSPNNSGNVTDKLKGLFFEMDYTAMYSGAIIHSKENTEDDDIVAPDNCSSALSILEADGLFEREKANRLANKEISMIARFDSIDQMNDADHNNIIGAEYRGEDETAIMYHREYQVYDDCVLANFAGTHDYVLRNYFTTVFAKYRTYSYASYDENVNRAETDKYLVFLSDDRCYYEDDNNGLKQNVVSSVLSAFSESILSDNLNIQFPNQINGGYFTFTYSDNNAELKKDYFSDVNQFVSGYSLCFNIKMYDNITNGNYVKQINCYDDGSTDGQRDQSNPGEYVGSLLAWHKMPVSETDGFVKNVECYFGHFEEEDFYKDYINWHSRDVNALYNKIFELPLKKNDPTFKIGKSYDFCKDNKETIDFTLQYELVNQDDNVIVSEWLMKLTDFSNYIKFSANKLINDMHAQANGFTAEFWSKKGNWNLFLLPNGWYEYDQGIRIIFSQNAVEQDNVLTEGTSLIGTESGYIYSAYSETVAFGGEGSSYRDSTYYKMSIVLNKINSVTTEGGQIKRINVEVILNFDYSSESYSNGVPSSQHSTFTRTVNVDFQRDTDAQGYEFVYIGHIVPSSVTWNYRVTFKSSYNSASNVFTKYGSVVLPNGNPYNYPKTMYVLVSNKKMEQSFVYEQVKLDNLPSHLAIVDTSANGTGDGNTFEDVFKIEIDEVGRPYIKYHAIDNIARTTFGEDYESVQYWFYDVDEDISGGDDSIKTNLHTYGDNYLHFVFGINKEVDNAGNVIADKKIYISTLKNRGTTVYNALHREAGTVMNFAESENAGDYGQQLYVPRLYDDDEED